MTRATPIRPTGIGPAPTPSLGQRMATESLGSLQISRGGTEHLGPLRILVAGKDGPVLRDIAPGTTPAQEAATPSPDEAQGRTIGPPESPTPLAGSNGTHRQTAKKPRTLTVPKPKCPRCRFVHCMCITRDRIDARDQQLADGLPKPRAALMTRKDLRSARATLNGAAGGANGTIREPDKGLRDAVEAMDAKIAKIQTAREAVMELLAQYEPRPPV